jgi:hypothetical protein
MFLGIVVSIGTLGGLSWFITRPVPEPEGTRPERDITIGKDQVDRTRRLREMQPLDVDIARRDSPRRPITKRDIEMRRAGQRISRGW